MEVSMNTLTPELFLELYTSVGWEPPGIEQVAQALKNTVVTFTAWEGGRALGMARLLGDGGMSYYIKDFAVRPDCQGLGAGAALMDSIEAYIHSQLRAGWAVSLELISTQEAVGFYQKRGFEERPCAWDGPGMFRMIRSGQQRENGRK